MSHPATPSGPASHGEPRPETEAPGGPASGGPDPAVTAPDAAPDVPWERLSPRMLAIHPLRAVRELLPVLVPMVLVWRSGDIGDLVTTAIATTLVLALALLRWLTTRYRVTDRQVQLRSGLLNRQVLTVPIDRVRTVDLEAGPVQRVLGITKAVVGTGAHATRHPLALDGLLVADAERLRVALLHRDGAAPAAGPDAASQDADAAPDAGFDPGAARDVGAAPTTAAPAPDEVVLARLDPAWVRYAPLSTVGIVTALGLVGLAAQGLRMAGVDDAVYASAEQALAAAGLVVALVLVTAALLTAVVLGGIVQYALAFWGLRVTRHGAGTLRVTRGLLTTRSTTVEEARVRGVRLGEPVLLRLAGAATLDVVVAGVRTDQSQSAGSDTLLPASPRPVDVALGREVLGADVLDVPLVRHGARATRRRWSRALQAAALVAAGNLAPWWWWGWPVWTLAPAALAVLAVPLAADRARGLGHAVADGHLVAREGSLTRATTALRLDGVLGWEVRQTYFQRRAGLATLTALTADGRGGHRVLDVPLDEAYAVVARTPTTRHGASPRRSSGGGGGATAY